MGRAKRWRVEKLPEKLLKIRVKLNLSQTEIIKSLGLDNKIYRSNISGYELGEREPPMPVVLAYAYLAGVHLEVLVDDSLELPEKLPSEPKYEK